MDNSLAAGLALLAVALVVVVYLCAYYYYSSKLDVAYLDNLLKAGVNGVSGALRTAAEAEAEREIVKKAWQQASQHGTTYYTEWVVFAIILTVLAVLFGVSDFGGRVMTFLRG